MIRSKAIPLFLALISLSIVLQAQITFSTTSFRMSLDEKGAVVELADIRNDVNYATAETSFLVGVKSYGSILDPVGFKAEGEHVSYLFPGELRVDLKVLNKGDYLRLEVVAVSDEKRTDSLRLFSNV